jgi:hypothetical protein
LAKRIDEPEGDVAAPGPVVGDGNLQEPLLTLHGQALGTPSHMAPEQAAGKLGQIDHRTDVYGLGALLYEILTGQPPFTGSATLELLRRVQQEDPKPPSELWPDVPPPLESACLRALAKNPENRFPSAKELGDRVQKWQEIQRKQAEDEVRQTAERLHQQQRALVALTRSALFAGHDLAATFQHMTAVAAKTLKVERVGIWCYTEGRRGIRCEALYELSADRHTSGTELQADAFPSYFEALSTSEVIAANNAQLDLRTREFTETYLRPLGIGAMMDAPIHIEGDLRGVVCHEHAGPPRKWHPDEQLFGIAVANLVAQAIARSEHRQSLEALRTTPR